MAVDHYNLLQPYIERRVTKPFTKLKPDEQIIAHWALVYKELIKFNYSSLIGYDLDSPMLERQMKGISSDKKGGIDWYNYMYSEQYKDDETLKKDNIKIGGKDPNYWARLSIFEALERYSAAALGDFICPPDVLEWVKQKRKDGNNFGVGDSHIPRDQKRYENCKKACEAILQKDKRLQGHPIMCLAGAFWVECGWQFDGVLNTTEAAGKGNAGTGGLQNAGESWFGITFWEQKKRIINGMNLACDINNYTHGHMIKDLPFSEQARIVPWYLENMVPKYGKILLEYNKKPKTMQAAKDCIGAAFVFKAGNWKNSGNIWEDALDASDHYRKSVTSGFDGFALAVYMSMMFARFLKDKKVPKGDPWDK